MSIIAAPNFERTCRSVEYDSGFRFHVGVRVVVFVDGYYGFGVEGMGTMAKPTLELEVTSRSM